MYTNEAARQAALAGGPLGVRRQKVAGDACKPPYCEEFLMTAPDGSIVCPKRWADDGGERADLAPAGEPPREPIADIVQRESAQSLASYLVDQLDKHPELSNWVALLLTAHLCRLATKPGNPYPGAMRVLIDATGDLEALVTLTPEAQDGVLWPPADPPSPPASLKPPAAGIHGRRRWWHR